MVQTFQSMENEGSRREKERTTTEQDSEKLRTKLHARATLHAAKHTRDVLSDAAAAANDAQKSIEALQAVQSSTEAAKKAAAATVAAVDAAELAAIRAVAIAASTVPVPKAPSDAVSVRRTVPKHPERWQESSLSYLRDEAERKQAAEDRVRYALQHPEVWRNEEPPVLMTNRPDGDDLHMHPPRAVNFRFSKKGRQHHMRPPTP